MTASRKEIVDRARSIIIKVGSNVLADNNDRLNRSRLEQFGSEISAVRSSGKNVVVVSSGSVAAGMGILGLSSRPNDMASLQAAAAIGQAHLIRAWDDAFQPFGLHAAQVLLTANDFRQRSRYLNVRNTLRRLLEHPIVPIVNENDTVSVEEIALGDNDRLASMLATLLPSPLMLLLTNVDGLCDGDPADTASRVIPLVEHPDEQLMANVSEQASSRGRGGMASKIHAVLSATTMGECVILANGTLPNTISKVLAGHDLGTLFMASGTGTSAWKKWIGFTAVPGGQIQLDLGAEKAVRDDGRSLLPVGILKVIGEFAPGSLVSLTNADGVEIARGLINYGSEEARLIAGRKTGEIAEVLGHIPFREVVHRDNLALIGQGMS